MEHFGYALSYDKEPSEVIQTEINECLSQAGDNANLATAADPQIIIKYFEENDPNLIAVVECTLSIENGIGEILLELIVAGSGAEHHVSLEQISYEV